MPCSQPIGTRTASPKSDDVEVDVQSALSPRAAEGGRLEQRGGERGTRRHEGWRGVGDEMGRRGEITVQKAGSPGRDNEVSFGIQLIHANGHARKTKIPTRATKPRGIVSSHLLESQVGRQQKGVRGAKGRFTRAFLWLCSS